MKISKNETQEGHGMKKFMVVIDGFIGAPDFRTLVFAKNQKDAYATFVKNVLNKVMRDGVQLIELETEILDEKPSHSVKSITKTLPNSNTFTIEDEGFSNTKVGEEISDALLPKQFIDTVYSGSEKEVA